MLRYHKARHAFRRPGRGDPGDTMAKDKEPAGPRYSLWLMPEGEERRQFADIITRLSERFGTPTFEPHVTLLGGLHGVERDIVKRMSEIVRTMRPIEIRTSTLHSQDDYFRQFFVQVEKTRPLMETRARVKVLAGGRRERPYSPHVSFMYGSVDYQDREALLMEMGGELVTEFETKTLHVVDTTGTPEKWRRVGEFTLPERRISRKKAAV
jgi:2'-5' RNA ligase